jgi:hypothetical protein
MKINKSYKKQAGAGRPYSRSDKQKLRTLGFTNGNIRILNNIKQAQNIENLNADGLVYVIEDGTTTIPEIMTSVERRYTPENNYTDSEHDTDFEEYNGGRKKHSHKHTLKYSKKRETTNRRKMHVRFNKYHKQKKRTRKYKIRRLSKSR